MTRISLLVAVAGAICLSPPSASAQPSVGVPLDLATLQEEAQAVDPRARELALQQAQTDLRSQVIKADRLPAVTTQGQFQYQSDVPTAPFLLPNGQPPFTPPKDTYDLSLRVDERLLDPTVSPRLSLEQAELAESHARVRTSLYGLREEVNDAFFAAALLEQQEGTLAATIADLEKRLAETELRVREGTSIASDASAVEATLMERRQNQAELQARRHTALARLSALTGRTLIDADTLAVPELDVKVSEARASLSDVRARPEYDLFKRTRERLERQGDATVANDRPLVSIYGRGGYGKPALNVIGNEFEFYGLAGIQFQWKAWTWGSAGHERDALALQQQIVLADEEAFTDSLRRAVQGDLDTIDQLRSVVELDARIISLREAVERTTSSRLAENVVTASEYLDRSTELLSARFAEATHRIELAQASARFLTQLGLEVR